MAAPESRAEIAPDLSIDPTSIDLSPQPLVQGVLVSVYFTMWNRGEQNAFGVEALLDVDGASVNKIAVGGLAINESKMLMLNWTPVNAGINTLTLVSWYGTGVSKLDQNWANNNYTWTVNVLSRPDAQVVASDIQVYFGTTLDPPYIRDGETLTVMATVRNLGTAAIARCDVSLWETAGKGGAKLIEEQSDIAINGTSTRLLTFFWNTTNWAGKRIIVINVTDVEPAELSLTNNKASKAVKIHTKVDLMIDGNAAWVVDSEYKVNFFINVEDDASLTIAPTGNMTIFQDFDEQFDIVVQDRATLVIDGGFLRSRADLNFTVFLYQNAKLIIRDGASTNVRIVASNSASVLIDGSNVSCPSVGVSGGSLTIDNAKVTTARLTLTNAALDISSSEIILGEPLVITGVISGRTTTIKDTHLVVRRAFEGFSEAAAVYPSIESFDPDTRRVDDLPAALVAKGGAQIDLINVSVDSTVYTISDQGEYWTENRLSAEGTLALINVYRYLTVTVVEWSGEVVPSATVQVLDYFTDDVKAEAFSDDLGVARLVVKTDYIKEASSPFVGNLRVRADLGEQHSEYVRFSHNKYPNMAVEHNDLDLTIVLPPSGTPPPDPKTLFIRADQTLSGSIDRSIIIENAIVTVKDAVLMLEQDQQFQWFIIVRGQRGALMLDNSTLGSAFTFVVFLEGNARLVVAHGSDAFNVRVIAYDQSSISIQDSDFTGDIYARCQEVSVVGSNLEVIDSLLEATKVTIDGTIMAENRLHIKGHDVTVKNADLTNQYELSKAVGVRDLRRFVSVDIYGWPALDMPDVTDNKSFFKEFTTGVNITIEADLLRMDNAFIYAEVVNIFVARNAGAQQTQLVDSNIGAGELTVISDDLVADGCSFNRVLDGFSGTDTVKFYSCEFPGVVCSGSATAERYWDLTLHAIDGAGSIRPGAWLEVLSTETNETITDSERTNAEGIVTVAILANTTDRTGDYFVGSIMFRLKYSEDEYLGKPTYTPWVRLAMKADGDWIVVFPETIQSPKKDIEFIVYNLTTVGTSKDLRYYGSTFTDPDDAWEFFNETHTDRANRLRPWNVIRGTQVQISLEASSRINNVWREMKTGSITIFIVNETKRPGATDGFTPASTDHHVNYDGSRLKWTFNVTSSFEQNLAMPDAPGSFWLMVEITGGEFDPEVQLLTNRSWSFTVREPQNIEIYDASVTPRIVEVGTALTVSGLVRYIETQFGVNGSELNIAGDSIPSQTLLTGETGLFSITFNAPFIAADNYTITISAVDPSTEQRASIVLSYKVVTPIVDGQDIPTNWAWLYAIIIAGVLAAAIGGGFVIFLRRQWGKLVECGECGAFIPANSPKCPKCGVEFETDLARCSECEAWIPADSPSCPVCGTPFTIEVLERQAVAEEAVEQGKPIEQVTTSQAKLPPIPLASATPGPDIDADRTRRTRIKKRVKKRLTVAEADAAIDTGLPEEASDLFIGGPDAATGVSMRLPGIDIGEDTLSEDELSKLLPTEDMLKELMLTTDRATEQSETEEAAQDGTAPAPAEETMDLGLEEIPTDETPVEAEPKASELEEIPKPTKRAGASVDRVQLSGPVRELESHGMGNMGEDMGEGEDDGMLLRELGLKPSGGAKRPAKGKDFSKGKGASDDMAFEKDTHSDDGLLGDFITEPKEREAPKLCPNCGGNWILYKGGEYTCRICGEKW